MLTDPIGDYLTRIRNALGAEHEEVVIPSSRLKREMSRILKEQGYIADFATEAGEKGEVLRVTAEKVVVQNVNLVKRHTKPNPQANQPGGIVERESPIHLSNVMLFNPATSKGERVGFKTLDDGRKVRVYRSSGEVVDA